MRWAVAAGSVVLMVVVGVGVYAQWTRRTTAGAVQAVVGSISDSVVATGRVMKGAERFMVRSSRGPRRPTAAAPPPACGGRGDRRRGR